MVTKSPAAHGVRFVTFVSAFVTFVVRSYS